MTSVLVVGGTSGIGREIARFFAGAGDEVVLTGRDAHRAETVAKEIGGETRGVALELSRPHEIAGALESVGSLDHLVLAAIDRDQNTAASYDVDRAVRLVTLKLVGYSEVVHALVPKLTDDASVVLFGGQAKEKPYPGSTTVSTVNAGVTGLMHTLATELAPRRFNAIHPGIVGDSPFWSAKPPQVLEQYVSRTPIGRLATMADIVNAVVFLLRNRSVNGVDLAVDGGWLLT